jgi:hypothetical protein
MQIITVFLIFKVSQRTPDDDRFRSKHVALKEIIQCGVRRNMCIYWTCSVTTIARSYLSAERPTAQAQSARGGGGRRHVLLWSLDYKSPNNFILAINTIIKCMPVCYYSLRIPAVSG